MPYKDKVFDTYRLLSRLAKHHLWFTRGTHVAVALGCGLVAFSLRFDLTIPESYRLHLWVALAVWVTVKPVVFSLLRLDEGWWRYLSLHDLNQLGIANLTASCIGTLLILAMAPGGFPRSIYVIDALLTLVVIAGVRMGVRLAGDISRCQGGSGERKRALIYGAGEAGSSLLREIRINSALPYRVIGFVDDDPDKKGQTLHGVTISGGGERLSRLVRERSIDTVLIAVPSASRRETTRILRRCHEAGVSSKTVPGLAEIIAGGGVVNQVRDVDVEDLLGRSPAHLDQDGIRDKLHGKTVLITGAAGSIGSELCRQIARFRPARIVAYEIAETPLFELEGDMRSTFPDVVFHPEVGSIQNVERLRDVLDSYSPSVVYHAAAYKHVSMMESHVIEAVENNVFGTYNVARAAGEAGVQDFVMISTDKAVRPTSVMGATKRAAELLIRSLRFGRTKYVSVRFGNVLGSNGSVVPIFKRQIRAGGPVTVTHPDMRRFFMTIPEASQLVLQASTMGRGGEIFVLEMGEPVRIVDLARNLIHLSGLRPETDIKIEFTGARPGEKLYEEINTAEEDTLTTPHEKIRIFSGGQLKPEEMRQRLDRLRQTCDARGEGSLIRELMRIVPEYTPSAGLLRKSLIREFPRQATAVAAGD